MFFKLKFIKNIKTLKDPKMETNSWTSTKIQKLFRTKLKSKQTLFNAENRNEIPKSKRLERGNTKVRIWSSDQIPAIGKKFGFLSPPKQQKIICFYTAKGGVLKTTLAYNFARILALNGIKTLIIGLDIQCSITDICIPPFEAENLEESGEQAIGLYHLLYEDAHLNEVILKTDLPTLDIIPETTDLNLLEKKIRDEKRREYVLKDRVIKKLTKYEIIIFDNSPSWNMLIENALTATNVLISPVGCEIGTYHSLKTNLSTLEEFKNIMSITWDKFFLLPTLLEKTKLSQQIYGAYLNEYAEMILPNPIRRAIKGQEATLLRNSILEYDLTSPLAQDYYEAISSVWNNINNINTNDAEQLIQKKKTSHISSSKQLQRSI
jgi:chromosome partitioning protein